MRALLLTALLTILGGASLASADDTDARPETPQCHQVRPGLVECTVIEVHGSPPRTFYLLARSPSHYEAPPLVREDMARQVARTVRRSPF
jgi:hypothetical protein